MVHPRQNQRSARNLPVKGASDQLSHLQDAYPFRGFKAFLSLKALPRFILPVLGSDLHAAMNGPDYEALGIPSREEFLARQFAWAGIENKLTPFHESFVLLRFAVIFVSIADRARAGNASGEDAAKLAHSPAASPTAALRCCSGSPNSRPQSRSFVSAASAAPYDFRRFLMMVPS